MLAFENISKRLSFECCLTERVSKIVSTFNCVIVVNCTIFPIIFSNRFFLATKFWNK